MLVHVRSGKAYYGSTCDIHRRLIEHKGDLRRGTHSNRELADAVRSHPEIHVVFIATKNIEDAKVLEDILIKTGDENTMFNVSIDVYNSLNGLSKNPMVAVRLSKSRLGNQNAKGTIHTEEHCLGISKRLQGNKHLLGHVHSEQTRKKMSIAGKGVPKSVEAIAKSAAGRTRWKVVVDGIEYLNASIAAKELGLTRTGVERRCRSENFTNYVLVDTKPKTG